jgi:Ca2+-binding EF-hand superfamily protein
MYKQDFSVSKQAPFGVDSNPTQYANNVKKSNSTLPSAGGSSWPQSTEGTITGNKRSENPQKDMSYSEQQLLDQFSSKLASRGARGLNGLQRQFKIMDDDRSHDLDIYEFTKAIKDFRVNILERDIERLFNIFDRDRSGRVDYEEFLRGVRGEMNAFRRGLCERAFRIMDKDKSGVLNVDDLKGVYNGKKHPDVIAGKKTEDQVLEEFLDTFEMHYSLNVTPSLPLTLSSTRAAETDRSPLRSGLSTTTT